MHEHSLIKNMLDVVERVRQDHDNRAVTGITVELPKFGALNEEHFRFHFNEAIKGTDWEGLQLEITRVNTFGVDAKLTHVSFKEE